MTFEKKRVVVTGIGLITPLGTDKNSTWQALIEGRSGIGKITRFDAQKFPVQIAGEVKGFEPEKNISPKEIKKMGLFIQYGVSAALDALEDAGLKGRFGENLPMAAEKVGVNVSAGMGGLPEIEYWDRELLQKEKKTVSPFFVPMIIPNLISGHLSILINAQGPNTCMATACSSSAHAIGEAFRLIQDGRAQIMVSGGAEAVICELGITGFASMKALSTRNDHPEKASRPYDKDRDGFVLGEGAGVLVLEEKESAEKRGARIYAEIVGYGLNADAFHMTTPAPEGRGARACMNLALDDAKIDPQQVGYVNSHGTSTPTGDGLEAQAIAQIFSKNLSSLHVSSTKSMTGHLLGAAGGVEAAFSALSLYHQTIPPTINLENIDEVCGATELNFTANKKIEKKFDFALSNSFGFGGTNASLVFKK